MSLEETEKERHKEKGRSCEDGGSDPRDAATGHGTPGSPQRMEEAREDSPLEPSEGAQPADTVVLDF